MKKSWRIVREKIFEKARIKKQKRLPEDKTKLALNKIKATPKEREAIQVWLRKQKKGLCKGEQWVPKINTLMMLQTQLL